MLRPAIGILLAGIAVSAPAGTRDARATRDEARIARQLDGLVPGTPQSCVNPARSGGGSHGGNTVLIRGENGTLYRSQFQGGCEAPSDSTLVNRQFGSQLCSGTIVEVVDLPAGITRGSCIYSDFVPYRKPR